MSYWKLYLIFHGLDVIQVIFIFLSALSALLLVLLGTMIFAGIEGLDEDEKELFKVSVKALILLSILNVPFLLVPSKETMIQMIGAHYITNNQSLSSLPDDVSLLFKKWLSKQVEGK